MPDDGASTEVGVVPADAAVDAAISSPLDLLREEEHAREVLLLSFTLNLEFWERYALSVARGLGARVTVVADAAMVQAAPANIRYAGITYLEGRAACRSGGAFHPKLLVIADDDYATVAIGSGNATLAGWHDNAELWTVLRGDSHGAPGTFAALAHWLLGLPAKVRFAGGVEAALTRVAELLERLPTDEPGPRLLTSLEQPILDQVPLSAGAEELILASPFYDRSGRALRVLLERLVPRATRLFMQPRDLVADGGILADLLGERGQAETIASDRYYHGKVIEWASNGRRLALTGSPNLSWPALGQSMSDHGNCELALLSDVSGTLAPPSGGRISYDELAGIAFEPRFETPPAIILLGALLGPDRIAVTLARQLPEPGALEYLIGAAWETAAPVPAGIETAELQIVLAAGAPVRVRQGALISNVCFVADPTRFIRTRVEHVGRVRTDEADVFRDPRIADAFAHDLAELRQFLVQTPARSGGSGGGGGSGGQVSFTSWEEYLDALEAHIGHRLLAYGLALPALGSGEGRREEGTLGTLDDDAEVHDGAANFGDDHEMGTPGNDETAAPRFEELSAYQRRRYQTWCERLAQLAPQLPYAGRLVALRLILDAVRGELFVEREEWLPLVAKATRALGSVGEAFEQERSRAASLAAVALAAMRAQIRRYAEWEQLRFPYENAVDAVKPLLVDTDFDAVERYAAPLEPFFGPGVQPAAVEELVESLLKPDLLGDAVRLVEDELRLYVERDGNVIELREPINGDPRRVLLAIIALCEKADVAVTTPDWAPHHALAVWHRPELVLITRNQAGTRGAIYELRGFGPGTYKDDLQSLPQPVAQWSSQGAIPERARALLDRVGVRS